MPADILRDDRPDAPPAPPPMPPGSGVVAPQFADLADATVSDQLAAKKREIDVARTKYQDAANAEAAAMKAANERQRAANQDVQAAMEAPRPPSPVTPTIPAPPSRKLTDFLAPRDGEAPENTITKLIQGIGLMASGIVGLRRGDATAALAGLHGALKGWQEGDQIAADRHFADWDAAQKAVIADWERRHKSYRDALDDHNLTVDQKLEIAKLRAIENGQDVAVETFNRKSAGDALTWLDADKKALDHMQEQATRLREIHAEKEAQREFLKNFWEIKRQEKLADVKTQAGGVIPSGELLEAEGRAWFTDPNYKQPAGLRGQLAYMYATAVRNAGIEWAKKNGLDPMSSTTVRSEVKASRDNLTKLTVNIGTQEAAIRRFEGHARQLLELSEQLDRAEAPAVNAAIIKGERDFKGSPIAAALVFQAFEVGMEFSRVVVPGNSPGDTATREEARRSFAADLGKGQMRAVVQQAEKNAKRNMEMNKESLRLAQEQIHTLGGRLEAPPMPPPPAGTDAKDPLGILAAPAEKK